MKALNLRIINKIILGCKLLLLLGCKLNNNEPNNNENRRLSIEELNKLTTSTKFKKVQINKMSIQTVWFDSTNMIQHISIYADYDNIAYSFNLKGEIMKIEYYYGLKDSIHQEIYDSLTYIQLKKHQDTIPFYYKKR